MKQLEAINLHKIYSDNSLRVHAVRGVTLSVSQGEMVLLMGPSGSGKTTLLSMMGCILSPTEGSIRIMGSEVDVYDEKKLPFVRRRHIGFIFQMFNLLSALTAQQNVEVSLNLKGIRGREAKSIARDLLEKVGLGHRMGFLPRDLSGGEKQRVAIARALAGNPSIILADEPTGNLDAKTGRIVMELIRDIVDKEKKSAIIVTHDSRIADLADRVYHMEDGVLVDEPQPAY